MIEWVKSTDSRAHRTGAEGVKLYNNACIARRKQYPVVTENYKDTINELNENGFAVMRNVLDKDLLLKLKKQFEEQLKKKENLKENNDHFSVVDQPLVHCPHTVELAFNDLVINIASEYFKCTPALGTFNLRRSHINKDGPVKHQLFHSDPNSIKFIKFFFYLNDVGYEDGPFSIVKGSLNTKFKGWLNKYRWTEDEMKRIYGDDSIIYATGNVGDLFIANTTSFHRGVPPLKKDRDMLTLNYVIHPEDWKTPTFEIKQQDYEMLPENKKPVADFLIKV